MAPLSRHDRTVRLLAARLERLALASERGNATRRELAFRFELASVATRHAVELELLSPDEAAVIWDVARRDHPAAFVPTPGR